MGALLGLPAWAVMAILMGWQPGFALGTRFERAHGGALTAEELNGGGGEVMVEEIELVSLRTS